MEKTFKHHGFHIGRMISYSKSVYRSANPNHVCVFNANIITARDGKQWYGDLDLTLDADTLKTIANELGTTLYVLRESDARFENENLDGSVLIKKAVWDTTQDIPFQ